MKNIPEKFKKALLNKNYELLQKELAFMTDETLWPEQILGVKKIVSTWSKDYDDSYDVFTITFTTPDWTPLAMAASYLDKTAVDMILHRWTDTDFIIRSYKALIRAKGTLEQNYFWIDESYPYTSWDACYYQPDSLDKAVLLLLNCASSRLDGYEYSKHEKVIIGQTLSKEISEIKSIEKLINFYDEYIKGSYITQHRHRRWNEYSSFFRSNPKYPNSQINFIQKIQEQALILLSKANEENIDVTHECSNLLVSNLFLESHYEHGVVGRHIKETIERIEKINGRSLEV